MLFVGTSIIHPSTEGVFLLCNILDLLIYSKVVVIPSSIHEMLILSADILELERMEELTKMVQDVNANEVLVREQLSDRAYILDI